MNRIVNVVRESEFRKQRQLLRICFVNEPEPTWIGIEELYEVLAHGEPGEYILRGL